jgi:hypothetical protein
VVNYFTQIIDENVKKQEALGLILEERQTE